MKHVRGTIAVLFGATLALSACGGADAPQLMNIRSHTAGPDEFGILPTKPLQMPEEYATLPTPTPGGANLTDPTPNADAVAALGGNPAALARTGVARADQGLIASTSRYGVAANIREQLAAEDLAYRQQNDGRVLERLFNVNVYYKAYRSQALDQYSELYRFRRAGVRTPAAPPNPQDAN